MLTSILNKAYGCPAISTLHLISMPTAFSDYFDRLPAPVAYLLEQELYLKCLLH